MGRWCRAASMFALCAWLVGCAIAPPPPVTIEEQYEPELAQVPTPLVEYPPLEPIEPVEMDSTEVQAPRAQPEPTSPVPSPQPDPLAMAAPSPIAVPPAAAPAPAPTIVVVQDPEAAELAKLLVELQRYGALGQDDIRREIEKMTQTLARQRTDVNRVRLAVLYSLSGANPQDDQRALQLFGNVAKSNPGSPEVKRLAAVLQVQVAGRQRAVREEQQKADAALQKLEALRQMERSLLRDRVRSGGGGGGGGGGSGGSGGGGQ